MQFLSSNIKSLAVMAEEADVHLLRAVIVTNKHNILRRLCLPIAQKHYFLRPGPSATSHSFQLLAQGDRCFVPRALYKCKSKISVSVNLTTTSLFFMYHFTCCGMSACIIK